MQSDEILEFVVDILKFVSNELLKHENVFVLVNVVKAVDIGTKSTSQLPSVGCLETLETVFVGVQVLQFTNVDQVFTFNQS